MTRLDILKEQIKYKTNRSTQRVYNTFEKSQTLTPPPSPLSPLHLFFLHNFLFFSLGKKERILPCLVASCIGVYSLFSFFTFLLLSVRFLCVLSIWQEFLTVSVRQTFNVNVAINVTRRPMWRHVTKWAVDKTLISNITLQKNYQSDSCDIYYVENIW